eukprot:TRINITY_DN22312_c0_g2_i1.p2 TRINITY_DN22312_c0_g2~~TRINITY_DN22312_c0_g2_i1.p2  ORF type:complete len:128 (-),score=24.43 TRINITY_DN22312_c0_g2_i1:117-500(-)
MEQINEETEELLQRNTSQVSVGDKEKNVIQDRIDVQDTASRETAQVKNVEFEQNLHVIRCEGHDRVDGLRIDSRMSGQVQNNVEKEKQLQVSGCEADRQDSELCLDHSQEEQIQKSGITWKKQSSCR